jgi:3-dehydroquinate synthase
VSTAVSVALGDRSYEIHVGPGLLSHAAELLQPVLKQRRVFVVTDSNVALLYLNPLSENLRAADIQINHVVVPAGETSKDMPKLARVLDAMLAAKCERSTMIVALGGGVVGDLAGFAASVLLRGVDFMQIPTTLLAQVDSSVGGKTGINTSAGKNLVGTFHQPRLVLADTDTLVTLPNRELLAGYAEIVKHALLGDENFWEWLEKNGTLALTTKDNQEALRRCITTSCEAKARIVASDEKESGARALLNLGHTFGHALETEFGYEGGLLHGEAVSIGIMMAFDLSVRMGICPAADAERVRAHFETAGLPVAPPKAGRSATLNADKLFSHMAQDKKVKDGAINFVLVRGIGKAFLTADVPADKVRETLDSALAI